MVFYWLCRDASVLSSNRGNDLVIRILRSRLVGLSVCQWVCLDVCLSVCLSVNGSVCRSVSWLAVGWSVSLSVVSSVVLACLCGSLAVQCALSLKRLSAGPGFSPQTRQNKLFQNYWRACFEINFSDRQEGLTVSSIICDR